MICLGDEIFSFLLANDNYMYFPFLVNGLQGIRTLKNRASLPSLLDNTINIDFNFNNLYLFHLISSLATVFESFPDLQPATLKNNISFASKLIHFLSSRQRSQQCVLIRIFKVTAYGQTTREACDMHIKRL